MTIAARTDRAGWRRRSGSTDSWEMIVVLKNCTQGEIWERLQKESFLRVPADQELNREWEFAITLEGESPRRGATLADSPKRAFYDGYRTKVMRPR